MMRLIDGDKLLNEYFNIIPENSGTVDAGRVYRLIKNSPTVDEPMVNVGVTVYVISKYGCGEFEIIECAVTRLTYKSKFCFTVHGKYSNGNYYTANYVEKSIGKKVFLNKNDAENHLSLLTTKKW